MNLTLLQLQFQNFVPNQAAFLYHMISTLCANDDYSQCVFTSPSMVILETHLHTLDLFYQTSRLLVSLCSVKIVRHPSFKLRQSETNLSSNHSHRPQSSSHPNHWPSMTPRPGCALSEARASVEEECGWSLSQYWHQAAVESQLRSCRAAMYSKLWTAAILTTGFKTATQGVHLFRRTPH